MLITKCPHVHRKHYAKVITFIFDLFNRTCAPVVTGSTGVTRMPGTANTQTVYYIRWVCARPAICPIITR